MYGDALTTKERVKDRLQISAGTANFDDVIDNAILAVTARIEQMTGRRFVEGTFTHELHDGLSPTGARRKVLILKNAPVQAVSAVEYNAGSNSNPIWIAYTADDYDLDLASGLVYFLSHLPDGRQNIRVTYTGGFSGYSIGINNFWVFNVTPAGDVDGANLTFTLPDEADEVIVYADGIRESSANVTHEEGGAEFTLAEGRAPASTISADYKRSSVSEGADISLPADLVDVCEAAVSRIFNKRKAEGKTTEAFETSTVTWVESYFTKQDVATIKNYRRGYNL